MYYQKQGYPEEDEIVLCTVKNVQYHSVFAVLDHYTGKTGMIHISEVSPGRIRNIRDYVVEGKKIFCKVLRTNTDKGYIDLSLRRVNEAQKRRKNDQIKQEQRAEKIIDAFAHITNQKPEEAYAKVSKHILAEYEFIYEAFNDVVEENLDLKRFGFTAEYIAPLQALVKEKIKPKVVEISGSLTLKTYEDGGLNIIKDALCKEESDQVTIRYKGGGYYSITVKSSDYKDAEKKMKTAVDNITKTLEKSRGTAEFKRKD